MTAMRLLELPSHGGRDYRLLLLFPGDWGSTEAKTKATTVVKDFLTRDALFMRTEGAAGQEFEYNAFPIALQEVGFILIEDMVEGPYWDHGPYGLRPGA